LNAFNFSHPVIDVALSLMELSVLHPESFKNAGRTEVILLFSSRPMHSGRIRLTAGSDK
jgi:hypothetical protein